jgi:hypothetical protein
MDRASKRQTKTPGTQKEPETGLLSNRQLGQSSPAILLNWRFTALVASLGAVLWFKLVTSC